jgi:hypothetical protein
MTMTLDERLCDLCKHRHHGTRPPTCAAFPHRIPLDIRLMYADHRQPYPGDHGITFEAKEGPEIQERLRQVSLRKRPRTETNVLDRRVQSVLLLIGDERKQSQLNKAVRQADTFEGLPEWCQRLVLAAEAEMAESAPVAVAPSARPL